TGLLLLTRRFLLVCGLLVRSGLLRRRLLLSLRLLLRRLLLGRGLFLSRRLLLFRLGLFLSRRLLRFGLGLLLLRFLFRRLLLPDGVGGPVDAQRRARAGQVLVDLVEGEEGLAVGVIPAGGAVLADDADLHRAGNGPLAGRRLEVAVLDVGTGLR